MRVWERRLGQSGDDLRKAIIDATIAGQTNAADINSKNTASLLGRYSTLNANATPTFNYPGIATDDTNKTMANLAAYRALQSGRSATEAAASVPNMTGQVTGAAKDAAGNVVDSNFQANQLANLGKGFENLVSKGTDAYTKIKNAFGDDNKTDPINS
jgi:hypothetical protein